MSTIPSKCETEELIHVMRIAADSFACGNPKGIRALCDALESRFAADQLLRDAVICMADLRRRLEQNHEPDTCFPWAERIEETALSLGVVRRDSIGNIVATLGLTREKEATRK